MVFDNKQSIGMPLSGNFTVTLTFDLLTAKCTHFICVPTAQEL